MTALTALLDHLYEGDVVDTADVARVSDTNPRSVTRWKADEASPRREAEERLLELSRRCRPREESDARRCCSPLVAFSESRPRIRQAARSHRSRPVPAGHRSLACHRRGRHWLTSRRSTRAGSPTGADVEDLLPRDLWLVTTVLTKVLDLTDAETLRALGVEPDELVRDDLQLTHEIGEAAHEHRLQAIRSASVTGVDDVVACILRICLEGPVRQDRAFVLSRAGDPKSSVIRPTTQWLDICVQALSAGLARRGTRRVGGVAAVSPVGLARARSSPVNRSTTSAASKTR